MGYLGCPIRVHDLLESQIHRELEPGLSRACGPSVPQVTVVLVSFIMLPDGTGYPAYWGASARYPFLLTGSYVSLGETGSLPDSRLVCLSATLLVWLSFAPFH